MNLTVYEDKYFHVVSPALPLNCRDDGGHLILLKKEKVTDRSDMNYQEAIDFMRISMAVGKAMYDVLRIERMNYEDLGTRRPARFVVLPRNHSQSHAWRSALRPY